MSDFGTLLRKWRSSRHFSQLALATEAEVSARHISFLESGRAGPSRKMVHHLAQILSVPIKDQNALLVAAGFAPRFQRSDLSETHMQAVSKAMKMMLANHDPYPAIILDRVWTVVDANRTASMLFGMAGIVVGDSLLKLIRSDQAPNMIENWAEVGYHTLVRLRSESRAQGGIAVLDAAATHLARDPAVTSFVPDAKLSPIIPTIYRNGPLRIPLFSTYAQFGSAEDLAIADLKIELMFPSNKEAELMLKSL